MATVPSIFTVKEVTFQDQYKLIKLLINLIHYISTAKYLNLATKYSLLTNIKMQRNVTVVLYQHKYYNSTYCSPYLPPQSAVPSFNIMAKLLP